MFPTYKKISDSYIITSDGINITIQDMDYLQIN